ncbi:MAG: hypothetical protein WB643_06140 [Candidatus Bathyarchaeia archaeon]
MPRITGRGTRPVNTLDAASVLKAIQATAVGSAAGGGGVIGPTTMDDIASIAKDRGDKMTSSSGPAVKSTPLRGRELHATDPVGQTEYVA